MSSCYCTGVKNGEPFCPCVMKAKGIYKKDGNWVHPESIVGKVYEGIDNDIQTKTP